MAEHAVCPRPWEDRDLSVRQSGLTAPKVLVCLPCRLPSVLQSGALKPLAPGNRSDSPSVPQVLGLYVFDRDTFSVNGLSVRT